MKTLKERNLIGVLIIVVGLLQGFFHPKVVFAVSEANSLSQYSAEDLKSIVEDYYFSIHNDGIFNKDQIVASDFSFESNWAWGLVTIRANDEMAGPSIVVFLAKNENGWKIYFEGDTDFVNNLENLPAGLMPETIKNVLGFSILDIKGIDSAQLSFPFPVGETWRLTGGPHYNSSSLPNEPFSALDFSVDLSKSNGHVVASNSGVVFRTNTCQNFILIKHADGWETGYYHLINEGVSNGQTVQRGEYLGKISTAVGCGGSATGPHVHFTLRKNGVKQRIADHNIGGYSVHEYYDGNNNRIPYKGCLKNIMHPDITICQWGYVRNDGVIGGGENQAEDQVLSNATTDVEISQESINLNVCADNLDGKIVYATLYRNAVYDYPAKTWRYQKQATNNCVDFFDMDNSGDTFSNINYFTVVSISAISDEDAQAQRTACYSATGGKQLCDAVKRTDFQMGVINDASSYLTITQPEAALKVCGSNIDGKRIYATLYRDAANGYAAKTWTFEKTASGDCVNFLNMEGEGDTFAGITYYSVASLNPISSSDATAKRTACYSDTSGKQLCDGQQRSSNTSIFESGYSRPSITQAEVNLEVCAANLSGKTVYATLWRGPFEGYAEKLWRFSEVAVSNCVKFTNMEGSGDTFNTTYYTVASLNPISDSDGKSMRTACYTTTGGRQLCDALRLGESPPQCYSLTTNLNPQSGGVIYISPKNSDGCPNGEYRNGSQVSLTTQAATGYQFASWVGAEGGSSTSITITSDKSVTANFNYAEFNSNWMPDDIFTSGTSATTGQIRQFLESKNSCLANSIQDTDGQMIDIPQLIHDAAVLYEINPKVILTTIQKEQGAISKCPSSYSLSKLMGVEDKGLSNTAKAQINNGTKLLRTLLNEVKTNGVSRSGWRTHVPKSTADGVIITPASEAITALFTYTPYAGVNWGGNHSGVGGNHLFVAIWKMYDFDHPFDEPPCYSLSVNLENPIAGVIYINPLPNCSDSKSNGLYTEGTEVTLIAQPNQNYDFDQWLGDENANTSWFTLNLNANKQIVAKFKNENNNKVYLPIVIR